MILINAVNTYTCVAGFKGEYNTAVSTVCRYITRVAGSLGYIDTINPYAYCGNNPLNWIDPWGLSKEWPWFKGAGGTLVDISVVGTAAHVGWDVGVGFRNLGLLLIDSSQQAFEMGEKRRGVQAEYAELGDAPNQDLDKDQDPIAEDFNDWGVEVIERASSSPNVSFSGPAMPITQTADIVCEGVKGAIGSTNNKDCEK